jgi:hypothetical protein
MFRCFRYYWFAAVVGAALLEVEFDWLQAVRNRAQLRRPHGFS